MSERTLLFQLSVFVAAIVSFSFALIMKSESFGLCALILAVINYGLTLCHITIWNPEYRKEKNDDD